MVILMNKRKKLLIFISVPVIVIAIIVAVMIIIHDLQPYRLYSGDRITGEITVYVDGKQYDLNGYSVSCIYGKRRQEAVSYSAGNNGALSFSTAAGEHGGYEFNMSKNSGTGDKDKIISLFSFDYLNLNKWQISDIHYVLNIISKANGYKASIKIDYTHTGEDGKVYSESVTDEADLVTGEAHCTTFGG